MNLTHISGLLQAVNSSSDPERALEGLLDECYDKGYDKGYDSKE